MRSVFTSRRMIESVDVVENHVEKGQGSEVDKRTIDELYRHLEFLHESHFITNMDFVEIRSRLWAARERLCETLLPPAQREKNISY